MKRTLNITQEERNRISNLHESAIKKEILFEQPLIGDIGQWNKFPCVMNHKGAVKVKLSNGTFAFKIGDDYYYNNGRKKMADGTMVNYSCNDEIFQKPKPAPTETQNTTPVKQPLSTYVKEAQKLIGMPESEQDGKFGPKTLQALRDFIEKTKGGETSKPVENMDVIGSVESPDVG